MNTKRDLKFEIRNKNRWTLVKVEIVALAILTSIWLARKYSWDLITGIIACIIIMLATGGLFFGLRLFRYIFTILFSIFWGFLCYTFVDSASSSTVTPWVGFAFALLISLFLHKDFSILSVNFNCINTVSIENTFSVLRITFSSLTFA